MVINRTDIEKNDYKPFQEIISIYNIYNPTELCQSLRGGKKTVRRIPQNDFLHSDQQLEMNLEIFCMFCKKEIELAQTHLFDDDVLVDFLTLVRFHSFSADKKNLVLQYPPTTS